jgi:E3 ubiquitin-protein ligase MARCH6
MIRMRLSGKQKLIRCESEKMEALNKLLTCLQIFQDGFRNLNLTRIFTSVIFPILDKLLIILCVPYVLAKGIVPFFFGRLPLSPSLTLTPTLGGSLLLVSTVYRYGFLCLALAITVTKLQRPLLYSLRALHNAIRDDKYLVGRRLHNYTTGMS